MRRLPTITGTLLVASLACADDVEWRPAAPLLLNLSRNGEVIETGRALDWSSPRGEPAAKLGPLAPQSRPAPEGIGRPHDLPGTVTEIAGPSLPAPSTPAPVIVIPSAEPPKRATKENFASAATSTDATPTKVAPAKTSVLEKVSVQPSRPQPWAPRPGQRTLLSDFFTPYKTSR
ncbi:MAG TPA: hypothetical protein VKD71_15060 [Gemmataceae bacterium]|nr:hypothetical protein [Gemmataceae bacterium]